MGELNLSGLSRKEKEALECQADVYTDRAFSRLFPEGRPPVNPSDREVLRAIISVAYMNGYMKTAQNITKG